MNLKDEILMYQKQSKFIRETTKEILMSEPQGCAELEPQDWSDEDIRRVEEAWKFEHLKDIYELTHDILGLGDAMESTVRLADRCGLGKEFRSYLTTLK